MRGRGEQQRLDVGLALLSREDCALRLRLGQVLEALASGGHCSSLGFSSACAYALERCDRSPRWVEGARCLARRLEALPVLRGALASGEVSWTQAELLARVAQPADESGWCAVGRGHTVRELRQLVQSAEQTGQRGETQAPLDEEHCTLTCTVDREEAWLFEATRTLLEQLGTRGSAAQVEALLAEGQETLLASLPAGTIDPDRRAPADAAQQRWREQRERWQTEAESRCEERIRSSLRPAPIPPTSNVSAAAAAGGSSLLRRSAQELDEHIRHLSQALARHELDLSQRMLQFHRANGWRSLGYATESQYARERLGLSRSSLIARRALAVRLEALPVIAQALGTAKIGVEAALQLVRIATSRTEHAWLERATQRTVKHLREEVAAALTAVRLSGEVDCPPPPDAALESYAELERAVLSGSICHSPSAASSRRHEAARPLPSESDPSRCWRLMLASLGSFLATGGVQMSAARCTARAVRSGGRVELRLRIPRNLYIWWRGLEAQAEAQRWLRRGMSWLRFLCLSLWQGWQHLLGASVAYGGIYLRDGYRCRSPVCSRRDVTPHHLRFRSEGGGDEPANVAAVCSWCHLFGIHGGCIRAQGTAEHIRWELGPTGKPCLIVEGRERLA
ncbi:MAG: hypothetical protein ABI895_26995 [Deltaproteobacteria bacterium]